MLLAAIGLAAGFAWTVIPVPWVVVAFGRETPTLLSQSAPGIVKEVPEDPGDLDVFCTYVGEGANVSVAVTKSREGVRSFMAPARFRRRPTSPICGSSACSGTSRP